MIVAVTGGRDCWDRRLHWQTFSAFHAKYKITELHEGGANGWDRLSRDWALRMGIQAITYWANWEGLGKRAGHERNRLLLDRAKPEWLIAGPGGQGTANMVKQATERGIKIHFANAALTN